MLNIDSWEQFVTQLYGLTNTKLIKFTAYYISSSSGFTKGNMILLHSKFDMIRKTPIPLDGEVLESSELLEWDSFITYDQLFDIFPIEFLEKYDMMMVRNWKIKKLIDE